MNLATRLTQSTRTQTPASPDTDGIDDAASVERLFHDLSKVSNAHFDWPFYMPRSIAIPE